MDLQGLTLAPLYVPPTRFLGLHLKKRRNRGALNYDGVYHSFLLEKCCFCIVFLQHKSRSGLRKFMIITVVNSKKYCFWTTKIINFMWEKLILLMPNKENNTFSYDKHRSNQNCPWDLTRRLRQAQRGPSRARGLPKGPKKSPMCVYTGYYQQKVR